MAQILLLSRLYKIDRAFLVPQSNGDHLHHKVPYRHSKFIMGPWVVMFLSSRIVIAPIEIIGNPTSHLRQPLFLL